MLIQRGILIITGLLMTGLFFLLPRTFVHSGRGLETTSVSRNASGISPHDTGIIKDKALKKSIISLRKRYTKSSKNKKSAILADSLVGLYKKAGLFDSAAWFAEEVALLFANEKSFKTAGDLFYDSYISSTHSEQKKEKAEKVRFYLTKVLAQASHDMDAKTKIAMTYVDSSNPMKGILMLREVLSENPKNELALFNMGMLSLQSGQGEKAISHLKKLIALNPNHVEGQLLLGIAYFNTGDRPRAKVLFDSLNRETIDSSVRITVESYLGKMK